MEEIILNKLEKEIIVKIREHTQKNFLGYPSKESIKKSSHSKKGLKKGKKLTNSLGKKINITIEKEKEMIDFIINQILDYEKQRLTMYFPLIKKNVIEKYDIVLSPAYLCNIKKKIGENEY